MAWFQRKTSFFQASKQEQQDSINRLIAQSSMNNGYYMLLFLATLIVVPGIFSNQVAVVIGGMILAPILIPLLSLSLSLVTGNVRGILRSLRILLITILMVLITSVVMTFALSQIYDTISWNVQTITPGIYIFIAFCAGIAGALAWVKENLSSAIAGVATAVALLPPLCIAGIGIAMQDVELFKSSFIVFAANLLGITMAAFLVFWTLGFLHSGKEEQKVIEKAEKSKA